MKRLGETFLSTPYVGVYSNIGSARLELSLRNGNPYSYRYLSAGIGISFLKPSFDLMEPTCDYEPTQGVERKTKILDPFIKKSG